MMAPMPSASSAVTGIVSGVVLLAGVVGFGVGVPEMTGETSSASAPELPDNIGSFRAFTVLTPADLGAQGAEQEESYASDIEMVAGLEEQAEKTLTEQYGDASVRRYIDDEQVRSGTSAGVFTLTVVPGDDTGLVIPYGPFEQEGAYELRTIDGHRCAVLSQSSTPGAQPTEADYQVECSTVADGMVYDLHAVALAPEDVAALLTEAVDAT